MKGLADMNKTSFSDVICFIEDLSDFTLTDRPDKTLFNKYDNLSEALKKHSNNVVHFSIWKVDDINNVTFNVIKEKNQCFKKLSSAVLQEDRNSQNFRLKSTDKHRIIVYIENLKEDGIVQELKKRKEDQEKEKLLNFIKFDVFKDEDISHCFTKNYCKEIGIEVNKTKILYIPIMPVLIKEKTDTINILCLYINNFESTIFYYKEIDLMLSRKIYESLTIHNQLIRNDTTKKILGIQGKKEEKFYRAAVDILTDKNDCDDCFIYTKGKDKDWRILFGKEDDKCIIDSNTLKKEDITSEILLPMSEKLSKDNEFFQYLKNTLININSSEKFDDYYLYYGRFPQEQNLIYSAILIPIKETRDNIDKFVGFTLFINKKVRKIEGEKYSPYFSIHNESIVLPSIQSIYRYKLLRDATKKSELLLSRIRHEIPKEVNLIQKSSKEIKDYFIDKHNKEQIQKDNNTGFTKESYYTRKLSVVNQLALSNTRIELFTDFATSVNFTKEEILENRKTLNLITYINSMKDVFRTEARDKGVDIIFKEPEPKEKHKIENVSRFYELAIHNIIFNAIRYSRFGTCVEVIMKHPGVIEIVNYGIVTKEEDKEKIYEESYRGSEAKSFTKDGLGFGLYLARKVINAHDGHSLTHLPSEKLSDFNCAGIDSFYDCLDNISDVGWNLLNKFIKDPDLKVSLSNYESSRNKMKSISKQPDYHFKTIDKNIVYDFVKSEFGIKKQIDFDEFQRLYLECEIYKTIFTIKFI